MNPNPDRIRARLQKALDASGWKARPLSEKAGLGETAVRDILSGRSRSPKVETLHQLAAVLRLPVAYFTDEVEPSTKPALATAGSPPDSSPLRDEVYSGSEASPPPSNARIAQPVDVPGLGAMRRDLPIYGTAAGSDGDGAFILNAGDVVDRAYRPPSLVGNTKAYGLYVEGDSMAPAYVHGSFVVADPTKKPRPGDNVIVVIVHGDNEHAERAAYVKQFVKQSATELHLRQHNPPAVLVFSRSRVVPESMHRLLTLAELMGVG